MPDRNHGMRPIEPRRALDARALSTFAGMGLACCLLGNVSLAQSEAGGDPRLSFDPIALEPSNSDPGHLIDFTALRTPADAEQTAPSAPNANPVDSLQAIATRWLNAASVHALASQARRSERPVILEPGYRANGAWSSGERQPSTLAELGSWTGFAPGQAWAGKLPIIRDRPFLPAAFTEDTLQLGAAAAAGQVDLIIFDVAITPDGQSFRLKGDRPPTIITAALGGAGNAVSASSAAAWVRGFGPDANIPQSSWRPPDFAAPRGRRTVAGLTASLGNWQPDGGLVVLQGLTPEDGALLQDLTLRSGSPSILGTELYGTDTSGQRRRAAVAFEDGWLFANRITLPVGRLDLSGPASDQDGGRIAFIPFIDTGRGWNTEIPAAIDIYDPWSIGVGIGWQMTDQTGIRLGVDTPLNGADLPESTDPEDFGLQLRLATELGN